MLPMGKAGHLVGETYKKHGTNCDGILVQFWLT